MIIEVVTEYNLLTVPIIGEIREVTRLIEPKINRIEEIPIGKPRPRSLLA